jgi:hypothetical protein
MAAVMGKDGDIKVGTNTIALDSWTLNPSIETADTTVFGSSFRSRVQTLKDWTVEASGTLDRTNAQQDALLDVFESGGSLGNSAIRLYTSTSQYWSGNAVLNSASVVSAIADKVTISYSLQGNGALSWTS